MFNPRLLRALLLLAVLLGLVSTFRFLSANEAIDSDDKKDYSGSFEFGGFVRSYSIHLPPSYDGTRSVPLLFVFHGLGGDGRGMGSATDLSDVADREGFIVVYPDGYKNSWADGSGVTPAGVAGVDDVGFVSALVDKLADELKVDLSRVYATGFSNGGMFAHRLGCDLSNTIAAIVSVGGTMVEKLSSRCSPENPVSVMIIHGIDDPIVPWEGGGVRGVGIGGWRILSVSATGEKWADINGCSSPKIKSELAGKGTSLSHKVYGECKSNTEVVIIPFKGGHTWPKRIQLRESVADKAEAEIDSGEVIWKFFEGHSKK